MDGNTRICKKCLLREMDEAGFFQNMYDYIARIPADDKAPEEAAIALRDCPGKKW